MFNWHEVFGAYLRSTANSFYVVPNYPMLLMFIVFVTTLPWLGARGFGLRGVFFASFLAMGVVANTQFYWVLQPNSWDEEFRYFVAITSACMTAAYCLAICLSAIAAARWLRRKSG